MYAPSALTFVVLFLFETALSSALPLVDFEERSPDPRGRGGGSSSSSGGSSSSSGSGSGTKFSLGAWFSRNKKWVILAGVAIVLLLVLSIGCCCWRRRKNKRTVIKGKSQEPYTQYQPHPQYQSQPQYQYPHPQGYAQGYYNSSA